MKKFILTAAIATLVASPAFGHGSATGHTNGTTNGLGLGHLKHDAPLPLAAGLPALVLMGGAVMLARRGRGKE